MHAWVSHQNGSVLLLLCAECPNCSRLERRAARLLVSSTALQQRWAHRWLAALARLIEQALPWPLQALALRPVFAGRALLDTGQRVQLALEQHQLGRARDELRTLVRRPTAMLDSPLIAAATIESLAENLVDSWLAPLLAYSVFGLSGAYAYRAVNTADTMFGYRSPRYEQLGKACARIDDLLNFIPARVGVVVPCAASLVRQDVLDGLVSVEQARDTYCVAFTEDGAVDVALTARLRSVGGGISASGVDM
jgi:cobalamin biosynthesis protein CobD/CbiB